MKSLVLWSAMATLVMARPDLYKEREDFHYSRSSSDEGTKSGYYDAQRGNMGGNYERAHNMDTLAQHQMGGLVKQIEGELGDGSNTRTGSVFSSANSRGVYGSGRYDLSNLQGRNFQEGVTYGNSQNSQLHSSSQSEYDAHSSSHGNARYSSSHNSGDSNYRRYQTSNVRDSSESNYRGYQNSHVKDAQSLYGQNLYEPGLQIGSNSRYSQSGQQTSNIYSKSQINTDAAAGNLDSNIHHTLISTVPVKIILRPGQRIAIPIAAQAQQGAHVASYYDQNVANTQTEILNSNGLHENYKPSGAGKHYESAYSYHKEWEKHDTKPFISTDLKNSELYDNSQQRYDSQHSDDRYEQSRDQSAAFSQSRYQSDFNAKQHTSSNSNLNTLSQSGSLGNINSHSASLAGANPVGTINSSPKSYQSSYSYHKSWERQGEPYIIKPATNSIVEGQVSGRLTDVSANSQNGYNCMYECRSRHTRVARSYGGYTPLGQHSQKLEDLDLSQHAQNQWGNYGQETQNTFGNIDNLGQQTQNLDDLSQQYQIDLDNFSQQTQNAFDKIENFGQSQNIGQETQNTFDKIEDLGQQTQTAWDKTASNGQETQNLEDFSQQSQSNTGNFENLGQQTQHTFDKIEDLGQQTQTAWDKTNVGQETQNLEDFTQQSQSNLENSGNLHIFDKIEDLGQQTQTAWDKSTNLGQETQNLEAFSQQSQSKFEHFENLGQQTQHTFDKVEDLGQQTQTAWDKTNVGQETQNLEDFTQQSQSNFENFENLGQKTQHTFDKIEDLGQQTQTAWDKTNVGQETQNLEDFTRQSQNNFENFENRGLQTQHTFDKIEDLGQQTQTAWDKTNVDQETQNLEDFAQQSQSKLDNFENLGQQTQHTFDKIEDLGQQTQTAWDKTNVGQETQNLDDFTQQSQNNFESLGQQTQNKFDNIEDLGQHTQTQWNMLEMGNKPKMTNHGQHPQDIWTKLEKPTTPLENDDSSNLAENKNQEKKQTESKQTSSIWNKIEFGFGNEDENDGKISVEHSHNQQETTTQGNQDQNNLENIQQLHISNNKSHNIWDTIDNFQVGKDLNTYEDQSSNKKDEAIHKSQWSLDKNYENSEKDIELQIPNSHVFKKCLWGKNENTTLNEDSPQKPYSTDCFQSKSENDQEQKHEDQLENKSYDLERTDQMKTNVDYISKLQPKNIGRGDVSDEIDRPATVIGYHIGHENGNKYNFNINNNRRNEFVENQGFYQEKFDEQSNIEQQENKHFGEDIQKHLNTLEKSSPEQQNNWNNFQKEFSGMDKFVNTEQQSISNVEQQDLNSYFLEDLHQQNQESINQEFISQKQQSESQGYKSKVSEFVEFVPEFHTDGGAAYNNERKIIAPRDKNIEEEQKNIGSKEMTIIQETQQYSYVTSTEKPSFWKRVGHKFKNAKEKVSSWFEG